jgi:hypothetical protein
MLPDNWLTQNVRRIIQFEIKKRQLDDWVKQGWIDAAYTSGNPRIRFAGEDVPGEKTYPYLASYTPTANDHVLLVRLGKTYIIINRIV